MKLRKQKSANKIKAHPTEEWRLVITKLPTCRKHYYISNYGRVKSVDRITKNEMLLKGSVIAGLKTINIRTGEKGRGKETLYIHRLVATNFLPKPAKDHVKVIHKDDDKSNNRHTNLKWATTKELGEVWTKRGIYDYEQKTSEQLRANPNVKLTEAKVKMIKRILKRGKLPKVRIGKKFGVSAMQIHRIDTGECWGYVSIENR